MATLNPQFVQHSQQFMLLDRFNNTFINTMDDLDTYRVYGITNAIIFAVQIGACAMVLTVLVLLTRDEKRRAPVFALNTMALAFGCIDGLLQCLYYTGPWYSPYVWLSGDTSFVPQSAKNVSIASAVFIVLLTLCIEVSLVLQLRVVCVTLPSLQRLLVTLVSMFVASCAIGFRIAESTVNILCNINAAAWCPRQEWLSRAMAITETISICFFSAAFCTKLGLSLLQRRRLGLTRFGPMQVIFIGGFQTLIIPAIFTILQFAVPALPEIGSNVLTVTAISLPLSSLWASANSGNASSAAANAANRGPQRKFIAFNSSDFSAGGSSGSKDGKTVSGTGALWSGRDAHSGGGAAAHNATSTGRAGVLSSVGSSADEYSSALDGSMEKDLEMQDVGGRDRR